MSDSFSSASSASSSPIEGQALNPAYMCFDSPAQRVLCACVPKVAFSNGLLDKNRSEVLVVCTATGFGDFMDGLLDDYELKLAHKETPEGRILGCLIFVGNGKILTLSFDANSPTIRKVLRDWKKHQSIQFTFKTDTWSNCFTSPLGNNILDKFLTAKQDKFDKWPTKEMVEAVNVLHDCFSQSAEVASTILLPSNQQGVLTIRR
jgi:hypothetical protein